MKNFTYQIIFLALCITLAWRYFNEPQGGRVESIYNNPSSPKVPDPDGIVSDKSPQLPEVNVIQTSSVERWMKGQFPNSTYRYARDMAMATAYDKAFADTVRRSIPFQHAGVANLAQLCDVFDYLKRYRVPMSDPFGQEYFARPIDYWRDHRGDSDDEAICMAMAVSALGAFPRIVLAVSEKQRAGYAYVEVLIAKGSALPMQEYIARRYAGLPNADWVMVHIDNRGYSWLSFDLNVAYPGGESFGGQRAHYFYPMQRLWDDNPPFNK